MQNVTEDVLTLFDQINDTGAGFTPLNEIPSRLASSTPTHLDKIYEPLRKWVMNQLQSLLQKNAECIGVCSDPASTVFIDVDPANWKHLYRKQYLVASALIPLATQVIMKWYQTNKIEYAVDAREFNNPVLVAPKKDDAGHLTKIRVCIDPRLLNKYMKTNDHFELPKVGDLLNHFSGKKLFGEIDLFEAFLQFPVDEKSRKYTAFTWGQKQYQFRCCPFGIKFIPSHFQRYITHLFADMPFAQPFIDNIAFASDSWEQHLLHSKLIIERLNSVQLKIKPGSTNLGHSQIKILGHLVNEFGIGMDSAKVKDILAWELPIDGPNLRAFMGFANFLRDHVRHFADISAPLEKLKMTVGIIEWTDQAKECFYLLKKAISKAPWLKHVDYTKLLAIAADSSRLAIGGILFQPDDERMIITPYNIIMIVSKKLSPTQQRYSAYKKELWAVVYCLLKFHSYIYLRKFTVITDHNPLKYIFTQPNISHSLQQWIDIIINYQFNVIHRPGILNVEADALSRMFSEAYETSNTWGLLNNITFEEVINTKLSPGDLITIQSIEEDNERKANDKLTARKLARERSIIKKQQQENHVSPNGELMLLEPSSSTSTNDIIIEEESPSPVAQILNLIVAEYGLIDIETPKLLDYVDNMINFLHDDSVNDDFEIYENESKFGLYYNPIPEWHMATMNNVMVKSENELLPLEYANFVEYGLETKYVDINKLAENSGVTELIDLENNKPVYIHTIDLDKYNKSIDSNMIVEDMSKLPQSDEQLLEKSKDINMNIELPVPVPLAPISDKSIESDTYVIPSEAYPSSSTIHPASIPLPLSRSDKFKLNMQSMGFYIPETDSEKRAILNSEHFSGHYGSKSMFKKLREKKIWWPTLLDDINKELYTCKQCLLFNLSQPYFHPPKYISSSKPGDHYQIDVAQMDDQSQGFTCILVILDVSSGFIILRPLQNHEAETIARELFDVFCLIGFPPILSSDSGPEFRNQILKRLNEILHINHRFITPYNPQANGKVERSIGTIKSSLIKVLSETNQLWPQALPFVQFCYNRKIQSLTNLSPYYMMFGRDLYDLYSHPDGGEVSYTKEKLPDLEEAKLWKDHCEKILALLYPAIELRTKHIKEEMIQKLSEIRKRIIQDRLPLGTHVLLLDPKYLGDKGKKKLTKTISPYLDDSVYEIIKQNTDGSYKVKNEKGLELARSVPIWQMKVLDYPHQKYYERPQLYKQDEYEVSWIGDDRINLQTNEKEYLTYWKGWKTPTWEPASHFQHAKAIIDDYEQSLLHIPKALQTMKKKHEKYTQSSSQKHQHISNNPASGSAISTSSKRAPVQLSQQQRFKMIPTIPSKSSNQEQQRKEREERFLQRHR
jgi:hypothetical protein